MIDFDAVVDESTVGAPAPPSLFGHRVTDLSATVGAAVWLLAVGAATAGILALTVVEWFVALALLVFVPLGLDLASTPRQSGGHVLQYRIGIVGQLPAAVLAVAGLAAPVGSWLSVALVLPWLGVAVSIAFFGLWRLGSHRRWPLPELAIDAALLYVPVGAVALVLHRAGISLRFQSIIILLTAVHYHYAGFVLPLVTGLAGRRIAGNDGRFGTDLRGRVASATTVVIVANIALIAVGITFSPIVEVVAVALFTVAVAGFAALVLWRVVPTLQRSSAVLSGVAWTTLFATMALALAYGYSAFPTTGRVISIGEMVRWHGSLNAFGFALPALLTFRFQQSSSRGG
jgi:hypothetical protein